MEDCTLDLCRNLDHFSSPLVFLIHKEKVKFQYCPFLANIKTSSTLLKLPRFSKYYEIQKRPQNIISLRMQTSYGLTLLADVLLFDQIKIFILQAYKSYFGSESTFGIWLFGLVLDILGKKQKPHLKFSQKVGNFHTFAVPLHLKCGIKMKRLKQHKMHFKQPF